MRVSNPGYVVYTIYGTAVSQSLNEFSLNSCVIINYLFFYEYWIILTYKSSSYAVAIFDMAYLMYCVCVYLGGTLVQRWMRCPTTSSPHLYSL